MPRGKITLTMRKLLLLRGLPGSGKSTFLRESGLEPYTLSADGLRMFYSGPVMEANGRMRIAADQDRTVWQQLLQLLEDRMRRGELVIVDATHTHPRSFQNYQQIANRYRYRVICVDFADMSFETCEKRNINREEHKVVPPHEMKRLNDNLLRSRLPKWITRVLPEDLLPTLQMGPQDISHYKAVHHIGDIQGCYTPLMDYFKKYGLQDDELYIFVGDYLDRGPQNAEVMTWLLENYHRRNFIFLEGNHEAHLRAWAGGGKPRSRQFTEATQVELEAAGFSTKKVHGFLYQLREAYFYNFHDHIVLVTHGGLATLPKNLTLVSSAQLIKGAGVYEDADACDTTFAATAPANAYQIHGHRNRYASPARVNAHCFNLEGKVEFGGELRTVTLTPQGFKERSVKSLIDASKTILEPIGDFSGEIENVQMLVADLRATPEILEKPQTGTNISSFNFSRDVFYKKAWDELNVHARGLFINTAQNIIVARSYEKFFNLGERPETQPDVLGRSLAFPAHAWIKENGYLGLVGYNPETKELVFASKSSLTSNFAGWLHQQFDQLAPAGSKNRKEITEYLSRNDGKTLVFEAIEPLNDPHIIEHDGPPYLVLLDIVSNTTRFEAENDKERQKIAKLLNCPAKRQAAILKNTAGLETWLETVRDISYKHNDQYIEGFVLEDAHGFKVKVKLPWYAFWRQMRTQLERLQSGKKTQLPTPAIDNSLAEKFLAFLGDKTTTELKATNIIDLRREFFNQ